MEVTTADLHTETFSNSQGWTIVRVTHLPTSTFVERSRSELLVSPVEAQSQCIKELKKKLARRGASDVPSRSKAKAETETETADAESAPQPTSAESVVTDVSRAEFDALAARVAHLEKLVKRD